MVNIELTDSETFQTNSHGQENAMVNNGNRSQKRQNVSGHQAKDVIDKQERSAYLDNPSVEGIGKAETKSNPVCLSLVGEAAFRKREWEALHRSEATSTANEESSIFQECRWCPY